MSNKTKPKDVAGKAAADSAAIAKKEAQAGKAEKDQLLTEALEESFPASDPISSMRFTEPKPKDR